MPLPTSHHGRGSCPLCHRDASTGGGCSTQPPPSFFIRRCSWGEIHRAGRAAPRPLTERNRLPAPISKGILPCTRFSGYPSAQSCGASSSILRWKAGISADPARPCDTQSLCCRVSAHVCPKPRGDVNAIPPLKPGFCDECGKKLKFSTRIRRGRFCCPACKAKWWQIARLRGGQVYPALLAWRKFRGRKGTPGEGKITEVGLAVDGWLKEDREATK